MALRSLSPLIVSLGLLTYAAPAWALTCDEIMSMVNVNVPSNIVVQTMEASGSRFTADDLKCLEKQGAPDDVLAAAKKASVAEEAPAETPKPKKTEEPDEPKPKSNFDDEEELGSDIPEGTEEASESTGGPKQVDDLVKAYRAKKYLTASKGFFELLEDGTYPDEESKIKYYLAKSLYDLGMYHGAQHYFMEVVRKGVKNPYFKYALPKLVAIAEMTGNDTELLRVVDKIPPEAFPRQAQNHLYYLMGRKLYDDEQYAEAAKYFEQVSPKSELYLKAKYYEGVIANERGKLKSAVAAFRDVFNAKVVPTDERQAQEFEALKDMSLMNIARIYYGILRYDTAESFYSKVDRDSPFWPQSLFERSWNAFMQNDLNLTLGLLLTVRSPYFSDEEFNPETTILRALTFFNFCQHKEVEKILLEFEGDYAPMKAEMKTFLDQYGSEEGRKLSDQAYEAYFEKKHGDSKLSKALFIRILRNNDLADLVHHLDLLEEEEALIDAQKSVWKDSVGTHLKKVMAEDRERYKRRASLVLIQEMSDEYKRLNDLTTQSEIIRFEVVDAQRLDYEYKMQNPEVESAADKKIDFATSREVTYWPFNGEFWKDELGYYRYTEEASCEYK